MFFQRAPTGFRNVQGELIKKIQQRLISGGFLQDKDDGVFGGITVHDQAFDRAAMRAMIQAFRAQATASRVFLNDQKLIQEGRARRLRATTITRTLKLSRRRA